MTIAEQNAAAMRSVLQGINARDVSVFSEFVAPDFVRHDHDGLSIDRQGPGAMVEWLYLFLGAVPDLHLHVQDIFATKDRVAVYFRASGTHHGEYFGANPSGRSLSFDGVDLYRFEGGKIAEAWPWPDLSGIRRQMTE